MIFRNSYDVVIVGNITKDFFEYNSTFNVGGSSIYAGIGSAMMGLKTLIISNHSISESDLPNHDQLDIYCVNSESNTEFVWNYEKKIRKGIIKNYTKKINLNLTSKIKTKMLMIAPIFNELDLNVRNNFDYEISLLSPQGLTRHLNKKSEICLKKISLNENGIITTPFCMPSSTRVVAEIFPLRDSITSISPDINEKFFKSSGFINIHGPGSIASSTRE